jgi:hypothetical protein
VGESLFTSPDGITWTERAVSPPPCKESWGNQINLQLKAITFGNGMFVAVGCIICSEASKDKENYLVRYQVLVSKDGINWQWIAIETPDTANQCCLEAITYGNGLFITVGGFCVFTSSDGITWSDRGPQVLADYLLHGIAYANNRFVTVGGYGSDGAILTSSDGITWTKRVVEIPTVLYGVTYGNNTFVATGETGILFTSSDGITWTHLYIESIANLYGITYASNKFVMVGGNGSFAAIFTSPDGTTWTRRIFYEDLNDVIFGNNIFVAVGQGDESSEVTGTLV